MSNLEQTVYNSFMQYAGAVIQSRALVDVRDGIKPSARQILYALYGDKFPSNKPYKKTLKAVGSLARFYTHGDMSAVGVLMRSGQPFAMRYPLTDIRGNYGNLMKSGNWASQRYTEIRLSPLAEQLLKDIEKNTIAEWRDNYDDTEEYLSVMPSKGFYNICNGTMGIAVGAASSTTGSGSGAGAGSSTTGATSSTTGSGSGAGSGFFSTTGSAFFSGFFSGSGAGSS